MVQRLFFLLIHDAKLNFLPFYRLGDFWDHLDLWLCAQRTPRMLAIRILLRNSRYEIHIELLVVETLSDGIHELFPSSLL